MKIKDFKEGDTVKITGYPNKWNGAFGGNNPSKISYPVIGKIDKMGASKYTTKWALNVNGYGFSLQDLIDQDMIELIEETPEYEVGDWIYWERPSKDFKGNEAWNVGSVGLVTSMVRKSRRVSCKPFYTPSGEKRDSGATYISNIRKALPHEIPGNQQKYEVGGIFSHIGGSKIEIVSLNPFRTKVLIDKGLGGDVKNGTKHLKFYTEEVAIHWKYIPPSNKQQEINLQVGDTFRNSVGNLKSIYYSNAYRTHIIDVNTGRASYDFNTQGIINNIRSGKYTDYTPASQQKRIKLWKKEDFLNTKIVVDTPEKSRRFQEFIFNLGIEWQLGVGKQILALESKYLIISTEGTMSHSSTRYYYDKYENREIYYDEIFNENNNQLNNNQNDNKESSTIDYEVQGSDHTIKRGTRIGGIRIDYPRAEEYSGGSNSYNAKRPVISY